MARYGNEHDRDLYDNRRDLRRNPNRHGEERDYGAGRDIDGRYRQNDDRQYGSHYGEDQAGFRSQRAQDYPQRSEYADQNRFSQRPWENRDYGGYQRDLSQHRGREEFPRGYTGNDFTSPRDYEGYGRPGHEFYARSDRNDRDWVDRATDEVKSWFGDEDAEQRREGDHYGRGPKNYQRSDSRIEEDVNDRLTDDSHVDASRIEVSVSDREVTLTGSVSTKAEKRRAEDCADAVSGVAHVQNNLRISAQPGMTDKL